MTIDSKHLRDENGQFLADRAHIAENVKFWLKFNFWSMDQASKMVMIGVMLDLKRQEESTKEEFPPICDIQVGDGWKIDHEDVVINMDDNERKNIIKIDDGLVYIRTKGMKESEFNNLKEKFVAGWQTFFSICGAIDHFKRFASNALSGPNPPITDLDTPASWISWAKTKGYNTDHYEKHQWHQNTRFFEGNNLFA